MEPIYAKCNKSCGHRFYVEHFKLDQLKQDEAQLKDNIEHAMARLKQEVESS